VLQLYWGNKALKVSDLWSTKKKKKKKKKKKGLKKSIQFGVKKKKKKKRTKAHGLKENFTIHQ